MLFRSIASGAAVPRYVELAFRAYLACGVLAHGLSRAYCTACKRSLLVAFSCKKRGPCPSCDARRMVAEAAFVALRVFPAEAPARQWVLSLPFELRALAALRPDVLRAVHRSFTKAVFAWQRRQAGVRGRHVAHGGAVTFVQRFGGSLNLNVHFHAVFVDGVYVATSEGPRFVRTPAPTAAQLVRLSARIQAGVSRWLDGHGLDASEREIGRAHV